MATYYFKGLDELMWSMQEIAEIPEDVQSEMLNAQADIVAKTIKDKGEEYGVHRTGKTLDHIKKGKVKRDKDGNLCIYVTFNGKNERGTRYAEIAFVNNYGTGKQNARPFVTIAQIKAEDQAVKAAETIHDKWLQSKNL